jgi:PAS domain S-box-containing protein
MHNERKTKGELIAEVSELRQRLIIFEEEQQKLRQSLNERKRAENIMQARIRLLKFAESQSLEEFTQATLDELEALTNSKIGFYHLVEADQRTLSLQTWSTNTLQHMCKAEGKGQHYDIAEAGVWVDCMHQRRPVIHNNYHALPHRKGMPPGHAPVVRELVVPIFRDSKIVAIIGVGNKPSDYDEWDVEMASLLGDLSWDITERKRAEEELHKHREELQSIMDSVPAMIFYKDKENRFIRTNQAFAEAMGLSKEELKGRSIFDLYPEHAKDYWKDDLEVMSTGISKRNIVEPMETSTGLKWVQTDKIPYKDALGNIIGIIGFAQDITERKMMEEALSRAYDELEERVTERTAALRLANEQLLWEIEERQQVEDRLRDSEARFTAFMEHLPGLAVMRDIEGRYLFANRAWEETMGLTPGAWKGRTLQELWPPGRAADIQKLDFQIISSGKPIEEVEVQMLADGPHNFLTKRFPIRDADGLPYMVGAIAIDVTDRKKAEEALKESKEKLRYLAEQLLTAQENERKRLAAELHDELGHALLALKFRLSNIEKKMLAEQEDLKEEIRSQLGYINEVIQEVRRLYHDLSPGDMEDLGLTKALGTLINDFAGHFPGIRWQVDLADLEGLFSLPVQTVIYRILQEALTNIGKHAHPEHVTVSAVKEGSRVHFAIQDDGKGFDVARVLGTPGRGVGLAAMEERLNMVGGTFEIHSREGEGTRLSFTIPTLPAEEKL